MSAARHALAVASLLVLVCMTGGQQPTQCSEDLYGTTHAIPVKMPEVQLPAGDGDFSVRVPNACSRHTHHVGTRMQVCDFDVKPFVKWMNPFTFYVRRYSDLTHDAVLRTTVFCLPDLALTSSVTNS